RLERSIERLLRARSRRKRGRLRHTPQTTAKAPSRSLPSERRAHRVRCSAHDWDDGGVVHYHRPDHSYGAPRGTGALIRRSHETHGNTDAALRLAGEEYLNAVRVDDAIQK